MPNPETTVVVYHTHPEAERAVQELQVAGVDMTTLSIVAKDHHSDEQVVGYYSTGYRMKRWGETGAYWGGFWGLLFGSAVFLIPGMGPVLVAGPLVVRIVDALKGSAVSGSRSAIGAGFVGIGVPKDSVMDYEAALKSDKLVLIANGSAREVAKVREVLAPSRAPDSAEYSYARAAAATYFG